jgi:hypothetical protein
MLAHAPRGLTEQFLSARGFSMEMLSSLVLAKLAIVVIEPMGTHRGTTLMVERICAADAGRMSLKGYAAIAKVLGIGCRAFIGRWRPATDVDRQSQLHHLPTSHRWLARFQRRDNYARDADSQ